MAPSISASNSNQALKITLRHIPACPAPEREKGKKFAEYHGPSDLLGLVVESIKKAEILKKRRKQKEPVSPVKPIQRAAGLQRKSFWHLSNLIYYS